jgi:hypothetical protein
VTLVVVIPVTVSLRVRQDNVPMEGSNLGRLIVVEAAFVEGKEV